MIGIIDYGAGNIRSVQNAFEFLGTKSALVTRAEDLKRFDRAILPGVGSFALAMQRLQTSDFDAAIAEFVGSKKPFLGICLGMQLLFEKGFEFGEHSGLGILRGQVDKFDKNKFIQKLKIPQIGWNECKFIKNSPIAVGLEKEAYFYFIHSYHVVCDREFVLATTEYGYEFVSAVCKDNLFGMQFHPEKSGLNGLKILKNFMEL